MLPLRPAGVFRLGFVPSLDRYYVVSANAERGAESLWTAAHGVQMTNARASVTYVSTHGPDHVMMSPQPATHLVIAEP